MCTKKPVFSKNHLLLYYVYILYSEKFDKYYIGHTDDIENRLWSHNNSIRETYTSKYRPWHPLACFEAGNERSCGMNYEKQIKRFKSKKMIKQIIDGDLPESLAQLVRVPNKKL